MKNGTAYGFVVLTILSILFLLIFLQTGYAQSVPSADDHYHGAAQAYIHSKIPVALSEIQAGLSLQPSHPRLQALLEKIKEQQKNKDQQNKENDQSEEQQQQDQKEQQYLSKIPRNGFSA